MEATQPPKASPVIVDPEEVRRADRKALINLRRTFSGDDVNFLNITAMMDMMTMLLVFQLISFANQTENVVLSDQLALPASSTAEQINESVNVTITTNAILVEGEPVVSVKLGAVDASDKKDGDPNQLLITNLYNNLKNRDTFYKAKAEEKKQKYEGAVSIISDKRSPYRLLTEVMHTASEAGYSRYRLVVLENKLK